MRISDWSSDVCSSDLLRAVAPGRPGFVVLEPRLEVPEHAREPAFAPLRIPPPRPRVPAPHGLITTMSAVSGNFLPSRVRAIWSMRLASAQEIGRASWRERVCQYVQIAVGGGSFKKKK